MYEQLDQIYRSQSVNRKKKEESFWKSINWLKGIPDVEEIYDMWTVWRKFIRLNPFSSKKKKNTIDFKRFLFHRIINSQVSKWRVNYERHGSSGGEVT